MAGNTKIEIKETAAELHNLLRQQKTGSQKERIQALYLLKTQQVETVQTVRDAVEELGSVANISLNITVVDKIG